MKAGKFSLEASLPSAEGPRLVVWRSGIDIRLEADSGARVTSLAWRRGYRIDVDGRVDGIDCLDHLRTVDEARPAEGVRRALD